VQGPERITIFDTTLRDGEQAPGCSMTSQEKLRMAHQIDRLGVDVLEAGFPISSEGDFAAVQAVARDIRRPVIAALARSRREDIERAWQAVKGAARPRIHTFLATSDIHLEHKLKISRRECLEQARDAVRHTKSFCDDVEFSPEDATRSDPNFLCQVLEAVVEAGATTINIPDTVGHTVPGEFAELITTIRERVRGVEQVVISAHCHDDLGLAAANSLAAIQAGARQVECTVNGIGERAGNTALEELVMTMRVRADRYPFATDIISEQLFPSSQLLSEITGVAVQRNKAIVGRNAFAHEAGIHQDGMLKNALTYEIMTPESVGVPGTNLVLGKHSGRHALGLRCEQIGFVLDRRELDEVYEQFLALADRQKTVENQQIADLIAKKRRMSPNAGDMVVPFGSSVTDGEGRSYEASVAPSASSHEGKVDISRPDRLASLFGRENDRDQQEDYLWGV
jgi:2-isopropylmalate synthase